jgi:uncharacterized RDD family membrane protein YckC
VSDLPPPPSPSGGWPQSPQSPQYPSPPAQGAPGPFSSPYGYAPTAAGYGAEKAGFWQRFGAALIDGIITALFIIPAVIAFAAGPTEEEPCRVEDGEVVIFDEGPDNAICENPTTGTVIVGVLLYLAALVGAVLYYSLMEGRRGQTLGKRALGIRVADIQTGQPIGVGRGVGRYFARILSGAACYLGYLWMLWDDQKQTWHDKLTSSVVVRETPGYGYGQPTYGQPGYGQPGQNRPYG